MTKELEYMLDQLEKHEEDMTIDEVFEAYVEIMESDDLDWDTIESLPIFYIPYYEDEDKYGNIVETIGHPEISVDYEKFFTKQQQEILLNLYDEWSEAQKGDDF